MVSHCYLKYDPFAFIPVTNDHNDSDLFLNVGTTKRQVGTIPLRVSPLIVFILIQENRVEVDAIVESRLQRQPCICRKCKKINDVLQCPVISLAAVDDSSRQQDYSTSCSTVDTMERMPLNM